MKPEYELPQKSKGMFSWLSGTWLSFEPKPPKEIFLKDSEVVLFFNNSAKKPNLEEAEAIYLNDLWETKQKIKWDQEKSKKKVFLHVENDPSDETQSRKI